MKTKGMCIISNKPWDMVSNGDWCKKHHRPLILCELEVLRGMTVYLQGVLKRNAKDSNEVTKAMLLLEELEDFRSLRAKPEKPTQTTPKEYGAVCLRITDKDMERLQAVAKKEGKLISEVAREAIKKYL